VKKGMKPVKDVESYFASVPKEARPALEKIRATVKATAPKATEKISYQMPMFYHQGPLVAYASFKDHSSFFPMSVKVMEAHKDELKPYSKSKGTIRFPVDKPLPAALIKKLVRAKLKENEAKTRERTERKSRR